MSGGSNVTLLQYIYIHKLKYNRPRINFEGRGGQPLTPPTLGTYINIIPISVSYIIIIVIR